MVIAPSKRSGTRGSTPPTTLVPPPYGTTAALAAPAHSSTSSISRSSRGRGTRSGTGPKRPRSPRTVSRYDWPRAWLARMASSSVQTPRRCGGDASRAAGSSTVSNGAGSSGSVWPKPSRATSPGAAARASAVEIAASSKPQPQRLRARMAPGPYPQEAMRSAPAILARGPWAPDGVQARWSDEHYAPPPERAAAADAAIAALRDRGSPSHDGLAARLVGVEETGGG